MMVGHTQARLLALADKDEIRDVLMRYGRGVDRLDEELLRSCYHPDSHDDHGHWKGNGHDFAAFIVSSLPERTHHSTHAVANILTVSMAYGGEGLGTAWGRQTAVERLTLAGFADIEVTGVRDDRSNSYFLSTKPE